MEQISYTYVFMMWICLSEGASFITSYKTTWKNAFNNCTIETPTILFNASRKTLQVKYSVSGKINAWVGYYLVATTFHYRGCMSVGKKVATAEFENNDPGFCYSACNNAAYIGVSKFKCYCLKDVMAIQKSETNCNSGCVRNGNIACGSNGYMSIYSIDPDTISYPGKGRCLQIGKSRITKPTFTWSRCNRRKKTICTNSRRHVLVNNRNKNKKVRWMDAMNKCFENLTMPVSVIELKHRKGKANLPKSWTRLIKSYAIFSIVNYTSLATEKKSERIGYLKKTTAGVVLKFDKKKNAKRRVLCKNVAIGHLSLTHEYTQYMATTKGKFENTSTTFDITSDKPSPVSSTKESSELPKCSALHIGIPIGVSTATLLILVTVCLGVVAFKRRRKMTNTCGRTYSSDKSTNCTFDSSVHCNQTYEISSETIYENVDDPVSQTNVATPGDSLDGCDDNIHDFHVLEINPMDFSTKIELKDCNADEGEDNEYDILNLSVKTRYIVDDTYDTTQTAAMKLKAEHSTEEN